MMRVSPYFSFRGRTNRRRYWEMSVVIFMLFFVAALVVGALAEVPLLGVVGGLLFLGVFAAFVLAVLANGARRLHDRGKSAWWLLLFMGLPTLLSLPADLMRYGGGADARAAGGFLALLGLPFSIWGFVVMGCLKGTTGPNKYGEDPLGRPEQEALA